MKTKGSPYLFHHIQVPCCFKWLTIIHDDAWCMGKSLLEGFPIDLARGDGLSFQNVDYNYNYIHRVKSQSGEKIVHRLRINCVKADTTLRLWINWFLISRYRIDEYLIHYGRCVSYQDWVVLNTKFCKLKFRTSYWLPKRENAVETPKFMSTRILPVWWNLLHSFLDTEMTDRSWCIATNLHTYQYPLFNQKWPSTLS